MISRLASCRGMFETFQGATSFFSKVMFRP